MHDLFFCKKCLTSYKLEAYIIWRQIKMEKKTKKKHFRQIKTGVVPGIQGKKKKKGYVKF